MSQTTVTQLPAETVKLITSTQIVTSVSTAVKELLENSIDAGAKFIQVRLENYGLDTIEVKDDGTGVSYDNVQRMFLPGYTSKIRQFEDLDKLYCYGFRGEALAALCKIGKVTLTTKTALDALAMTYEIDSTGLPTSLKPSHLNKGTIITVVNLFSNLPVRRLYLSCKKKMSEELKKTEQVVHSLSMIHPELGVSLVHNKCPIWKKNSVKGLKQSFMQVVGLRTASKMDLINKSTAEINVDLIVPKKNLDNQENIFTNSQHNVYVYVNKRPINCKNLQQPVQEHIFHHFSSLNLAFKYAVSLISINVSPQQMDINLEPNKTKVLLKNRIEVIKLIDNALANYYGHDFSCTVLKELNPEEEEEVVSTEECSGHQSKRPRLESESSSESVGDKRTRLFKEKNKDWHLEIINEDSPVGSKLNLRNILGGGCESTLNEASQPPSLCSQINKDNCILTTEREVSELNAILNETNNKLVTITNSINTETRLVDRNDIQSKKGDKKILPDWPCRPKVVIESQPVGRTSQESESMILDSTPPVESKTVQEIVAEIENDAKKWSSEVMQTTENEVEERDLEEDVKGFDLSMQSVSSQMGKKEMKAFTKFARIMRPKIIKEFPNLMFTQVGGLLADRWKALTPDEVKYYEKVAEVVDLNRRMYQEEKEREEPITKPPPSKKTTVKSLFERIQKKNKIQRPPRKEVSFDTSISDVKALRNRQRNEIVDGDFHIIGHLRPSGNWLYRKGNEIGHVRHQGLQELIIYQKMISSHSIPRKSLDKPIPVSEGNVGTVLWNVLISLDCDYDSGCSKCVITSDVIAKNGFLIQVDRSNDVVTCVNIIEVASSIPQFGIAELKEALSMYQKNGEFGGLANCRPTSVCNYLTNEAVRLTQISWESRTPDREEMEDMMNTYHLCLRHLPPICLHSRDIFVSFYHLQMEVTNSPSEAEKQFINEAINSFLDIK